mgnify:CR=1 FL=1
MKYLPHITILLWLLFITCLFIIPGITSGIFFLFPSIAILTIFLAVSFWQQQINNNRLSSLVLIGIFLINTVTTCSYLIKNVTAFTQIEPYQNLVIQPELAQRIYSGEDELSRENVSRYIFENTGVITAFKKDDGSLTQYTPTKLDISALQVNIQNHLASINSKRILRGRLFDLFLLLSTQLFLFILINIYLVFTEGPGSRKINPPR